MKLLSVNVGRAEQGISTGETGINKLPVHGSVAVSGAGLEGDVVCDTKHHGGPDQAVYVYGAPDYDWWMEALGRDLSYGAFGENLTIGGLESAGIRIGDRLE